MFKKNQGFTLIEMLLVIAIIGILAGAVYAMIGDSDDAKTKSVLSTAKSIMPYAQECLFKGNNLNNPTDTQTGGNALCAGSETTWPEISVTDCQYISPTGNSTWSVDCSPNPTITIDCDAGNGDCEVN